MSLFYIIPGLHMANKVEDLVNVILDSYKECDITARIDEENMLNKDILIEIINEIRKNPKLVEYLREDPKRRVEYISKIKNI